VVVLTVPDALNMTFFDLLKEVIMFYVNEMDMSMIVFMQMSNKGAIDYWKVTGRDAFLLERLDSILVKVS
jgi:hypothetical protein